MARTSDGMSPQKSAKAGRPEKMLGGGLQGAAVWSQGERLHNQPVQEGVFRVGGVVDHGIPGFVPIHPEQ